MLFRVDDEVRDVADKNGQKDDAEPAGNEADVVRHGMAQEAAVQEQRIAGTDEQQERDPEVHREVSLQDAGANRQRFDHGTDTEDHQGVEQVRADDITDGDLIGALDGSRRTDGQFRCAGTHGDDGEADDEARDFQFLGEGGSAVHEPVGTLDEGDKAHDEDNDIEQDLHCSFLLSQMKRDFYCKAQFECALQ